MTRAVLLLAAALSIASFAPSARSVSIQLPLSPSHDDNDDALWVGRIEDCPSLPRRARPLTVHDLRPDDFSYTMALGDSITAAWFARGVRSTQEETSHEFRGISYAAGGDKHAVTLPNMIRHYNRNVSGFSLGEQPAEICYGALCPIGPIGWTPKTDQLNAALSGSLAVNLPHQARDYLVPQARRMQLDDDNWKYLNLQIGSNDLCSLCSVPDVAIAPGSPELFEKSVREALEIVREGLPNTLVNIIGVFDISNLYKLTENGRHPYCARTLPSVSGGIECRCSLQDGLFGEMTRRRMRELTARYNERLIAIARDYQAQNSTSFGVAYQPPSLVDLERQPMESLSTADCFHPSLLAHERLARSVWSRLIATQDVKARPVVWDGDGLEVRCLREDDRILVSDL